MGIRKKGKKTVINYGKDDAKSSKPIIRDSDVVSEEIRSKLETAGIRIASETTYAKLKNHSINNELVVTSNRSTSIPQDAFKIDRPKTKSHPADLYFIAAEDIGENKIKDFWQDDYIVLGSENNGIDAEVLSFTVENTKSKKFNKYFLLIGENVYPIVEKFNRAREKKAPINFNNVLYSEDERLNQILSTLRSLGFKQRVTSYEGLLSEFQDDVIPLAKLPSLPAGCLRLKSIGARDRTAYLSFKNHGRLLNEEEHGENTFIVVPIGRGWQSFILVNDIAHELRLGPIASQRQLKDEDSSPSLPQEPVLSTDLREIMRIKLAKSGLKWSSEQYKDIEQFLKHCKMETSDFRVHTDLKKAPEGCFEFSKSTKLDQNVYTRLAVYKDKIPGKPANVHIFLKEHKEDIFLHIPVGGLYPYFILHKGIPYEICMARQIPGTVQYRLPTDETAATDPLPKNIKVFLKKYSLDHLSYKKFKTDYNIQDQLTILQKPNGSLPKSAFKITKHKAPKNLAYFVLNGGFVKLDDYKDCLILHFDKTKIHKLGSDQYFLLFNDELIEIKTKGAHDKALTDAKKRQKKQDNATDNEDDVQEVLVPEKANSSRSVSDSSTKKASQRIAKNKRKIVLDYSSSSEESNDEQVVATEDSDDEYIPKRRAKAEPTVKEEPNKQSMSNEIDDYDMAEFCEVRENEEQVQVSEQFERKIASTDDLYSDDELESPNYDDLGDDIPVIDLTTLLQNEVSEESDAQHSSELTRVTVKTEPLSDDALAADNTPPVKREAKSFLKTLGLFAPRETHYYDDPDLSPSPLKLTKA